MCRWLVKVNAFLLCIREIEEMLILLVLLSQDCGLECVVVADVVRTMRWSTDTCE